jgi:hypothetical protein
MSYLRPPGEKVSAEPAVSAARTYLRVTRAKTYAPRANILKKRQLLPRLSINSGRKQITDPHKQVTNAETTCLFTMRGVQLD